MVMNIMLHKKVAKRESYNRIGLINGNVKHNTMIIMMNLIEHQSVLLFDMLFCPWSQEVKVLNEVNDVTCHFLQLESMYATVQSVVAAMQAYHSNVEVQFHLLHSRQ